MGGELLGWPLSHLPAPHTSLHLLDPQRDKYILPAKSPGLWKSCPLCALLQGLLGAAFLENDGPQT